jgi:FkbM family methyltransferase
MGPRAALPPYLRPLTTQIWDGAMQPKRREGRDCILWSTPAGEFWTRASQSSLLACLIQEQLVDRVYEHGPVQVRSRDAVLDAGANIGTYTRLALRQGARLVVAFEPEPDNAYLFRRNLGAEMAAGKVILVEAAVWSSSGTAPLHLHGSSGHSLVIRTGAPGLIQVTATTIDATVPRLDLDRVDMIKLDVEGAEEHALAGARDTLVRFGPHIAACTYHEDQTPEGIRRAILEARGDYQIVAGRRVVYSWVCS